LIHHNNWFNIGIVYIEIMTTGAHASNSTIDNLINSTKSIFNTTFNKAKDEITSVPGKIVTSFWTNIWNKIQYIFRNNNYYYNNFNHNLHYISHNLIWLQYRSSTATNYTINLRLWNCLIKARRMSNLRT